MDERRRKKDRSRAIAQWKKMGRTEGRCDNCACAISVENSFQVAGPTYVIGNTPIDAGNYLICEDCYDGRHWSEAK